MEMNPKNEQELVTRLSLAADYIQRSENSGLFSLNPYNWTVHLQTVSFLYTYSSQSDRTSFHKTAERCFSPILERMFEYDGNLAVICDEKATVEWNCLAAICCFKSGRTDQGKRLTYAVRDLLNGKKSILLKSESHKAYPAIALLWADESKDIVREIAQKLLTDALSTDPADVWLLDILTYYGSLITRDMIKYSRRRRDIAKRFGNINPASMNSLFAGIAQQAHVANYRFHSGIFELQQQLQITDGSDLQGSFVHNKRNNKGRLDYVVQNAWSFLQQLRSEEKQTKLECCL